MQQSGIAVHEHETSELASNSAKSVYFKPSSTISRGHEYIQSAVDEEIQEEFIMVKTVWYSISSTAIPTACKKPLRSQLYLRMIEYKTLKFVNSTNQQRPAADIEIFPSDVLRMFRVAFVDYEV